MSLKLGVQVSWVHGSGDDSLVPISCGQLVRQDNASLLYDFSICIMTKLIRYSYELALSVKHPVRPLFPGRRICEGIEVDRSDHSASRGRGVDDASLSVTTSFSSSNKLRKEQLGEVEVT